MSAMMNEAWSTLISLAYRYLWHNNDSDRQVARISASGPPAPYFYMPIHLISAFSVGNNMHWSDMGGMTAIRDDVFLESIWVLWVEDFVKFLVFTSLYRLLFCLCLRLFRAILNCLRSIKLRWYTPATGRLDQEADQVLSEILHKLSLSETTICFVRRDEELPAAPSHNKSQASKGNEQVSGSCVDNQPHVDKPHVSNTAAKNRQIVRDSKNRQTSSGGHTGNSRARKQSSSAAPAPRQGRSFEKGKQKAIAQTEEFDSKERQDASHGVSVRFAPQVGPPCRLKKASSPSIGGSSTRTQMNHSQLNCHGSGSSKAPVSRVNEGKPRRVALRIQLGSKQFQEVAEWNEGPEEIAIRWKRRPKRSNPNPTTKNLSMLSAKPSHEAPSSAKKVKLL